MGWQSKPLAEGYFLLDWIKGVPRKGRRTILVFSALQGPRQALVYLCDILTH